MVFWIREYCISLSITSSLRMSRKCLGCESNNLDWLQVHFIPEVRKYLSEENLPLKIRLLLYNSSAHPIEDLQLIDGNFTALYMPSNCTASIQLMAFFSGLKLTTSFLKSGQKKSLEPLQTPLFKPEGTSKTRSGWHRHWRWSYNRLFRNRGLSEKEIDNFFKWDW